MSERWYVLRAVVGREERLCERLRGLERPCLVWRAREKRWQEIRHVMPWLPLCTIRRVERKPGGRAVTRRTEPMFPGHLLLRFDLDAADIGAIEDVPGALSFVRIGHGTPTALDDGLVRELQDYTGRKGGVIIDAVSGKVISAWADLPKGTPVTVVGGIFAGWNGLFQEEVRGRLQILFDMLGREVETLIDEAHVVAA